MVGRGAGRSEAGCEAGEGQHQVKGDDVIRELAEDVEAFFFLRTKEKENGKKKERSRTICGARDERKGETVCTSRLNMLWPEPW